MRIAVWHNLPSGGGKRALYDHVSGLVGRGHHVEVWCPPTANRDYLPLAPLVAEHVVPLEGPAELPPLAQGGGSLSLAPYRQVRSFLAGMEEHCRTCAREINSGDFDLVFANSCFLTGAPPLAKHLKLPNLLYLQEPRRWLYEVLPPLPRLAWSDVKLWGRHWWTPTRLRHFASEVVRVQGLRILAREEHDSLHAFQQVLVNSHFSRENLLRTFGREAGVCYLGIDTEHFHSGPAEREDFVIGLGAIAPHKNVELAVRAVGAMPEPRPRLVWVGNVANGEYLAGVRSLADSLRTTLEAHVGLTDSELISLLGRAFAFLYTSRLEPFGLAPLEASACGTPVVAVAEGGVRETIVDGVNGLLSDSDPDHLAGRLQRLRDDPDLARSLGDAGRRRVREEWSCEAAVDRLEARLERLASQPRPVHALS